MLCWYPSSFASWASFRVLHCTGLCGWAPSWSLDCRHRNLPLDDGIGRSLVTISSTPSLDPMALKLLLGLLPCLMLFVSAAPYGIASLACGTAASFASFHDVSWRFFRTSMHQTCWSLSLSCSGAPGFGVAVVAHFSPVNFQYPLSSLTHSISPLGSKFQDVTSGIAPSSPGWRETSP